MNVEREIKLSNFETKPNELDEGKEDLLQVKSNANPLTENGYQKWPCGQEFC